MGSAICQRLKNSYSLFVFDKDSAKTKNLSGVNVAENILDLLNKSEAVILAVKPQDFDNLLNEIKTNIKGELVISIAAGVTTGYIEKILGRVKVIRVMPNLPARIGKGMSCLCRGKFASDKDLNFAKELFDKLGQTLIINEDMMDAATAISGSGPGYFYNFIEKKDREEIKQSADKFVESLSASAKSIGFSNEQANILAKATVGGSLALLQETKLSPLELKKQITSKGGTTEAALEVLHNSGSLRDAVKAALKRAKELSKG